MIKFGVKNVMHHTKIFERTMKRRFRRKCYVWESGDITKNLQGYEPKALDILENKGYTKKDIITDVKLMPKIWYYTSDKKKHRYFPDIWIPIENKIIEVKSNWTYNQDLEINLLKQSACVEKGYLFSFIIIH